MAESQIVREISPAPAPTATSAPSPAGAILMCPSAQPDMKEARVIGVVGGTVETVKVAYVNEVLPVTDEILQAAAPAKPTEVFRFAAHCETKACRHFDGTNCNLATRIVQILPAVVDTLPACLIRPTCRWYQQEGRAACLRCPQVVTESYEPSEDFKRAAQGADGVATQA